MRVLPFESTDHDQDEHLDHENYLDHEKSHDHDALVEPRSERSRLEATLSEALRAAFAANGWKVTVEPRDEGGPDFLARLGNRRYAVELKAAVDARASQLQALLADAFVRARKAAAGREMQPLAVVAAPALSDRLAAELHAYAREFLDDSAHGIMDAKGRLELYGEGLESLRAAAAIEPPSVRPPAPFDPFSHLNQWMLKVLLAEELPRELLTAPREPVRNARQLAQLAKVSDASATRLVNHLEREGWLVNRPGPLRLARALDLLQRWHSSTSRTSQDVPALWALPQSNRDAQVDRTIAALHAEGQPVCLGAFSAATRLGLGHVRGGPDLVYYDGAVSDLLGRMGAVPSEKMQGADLRLRRAAARASIFRGRVVRDGVPVSDVVQTWLDVAREPVRGVEQAEFIWRHVMVPHLDHGE